MKILLLGEFSGLHKNLKEGLVEIGHEAVVAARGDGFKKIPVDISLDSNFSGLIEKIDRNIKTYRLISNVKNYDVVQLINPFIFSNRFFYGTHILKKLINQNNKFFILGCGDDAYFWRYGRFSLKYGPFEDFLKYDLKKQDYFMNSDRAFKFNKWLAEQSNGLIPVAYEYEISHEINRKRLNTIPMPININKIEYRDNIIKNKVVIFHGLNRYGFKGTRHVEDAFEYLSKKYPNDLKLVITGHMPLNEYLDLIRRTNIVIDQVYSYSLGMNGIYSLAMGKVVIGGAEPESLKSLGVESSPVINVKPSAKHIINQIEILLDQKNTIRQIGFESRRFVENIHSHTKIAQQYIDTWRQH